MRDICQHSSPGKMAKLSGISCGTQALGVTITQTREALSPAVDELVRDVVAVADAVKKNP